MRILVKIILVCQVREKNERIDLSKSIEVNTAFQQRHHVRLGFRCSNWATLSKEQSVLSQLDRTYSAPLPSLTSIIQTTLYYLSLVIYQDFIVAWFLPFFSLVLFRWVIN